MSLERQGFHIAHVYSLWQDLSHHTTIFDLVTLTLKFDLLFKNLNFGYNLWTVRDRTFIFHLGDNTFVIEWFAGINCIILWSQI